MRISLLFFVSVLVLSGCNNYYNHLIESDYSFEGDFNSYSTYDFIADRNFEGSKENRKLIEKYMTQTLQAWGYRQKEKKPNLLIFYNLYYDDFEMQGYDQPQFSTWLKNNFSKKYRANSLLKDENQSDSAKLALKQRYLERIWNQTNQKSEEYNRTSYNLREGTLLISLYDRKKRKTIWQGYASGIFGDERFDNNRFMRHIVLKIMDEYRVLADKSAPQRNS